MIETLKLIFPLVLFFIIGYLFKVKFKYGEEMGQIITKIILYITLPVTIFLSFVSSTKNLGNAIYLPFIGLLIPLILFGITYIVSKRLHLDEKTECVFITCPLITNTMLFLSPFIYLVYGDVGLTRLSLYDVGNSITIYMIAQTLFISYDGKRLNLFKGIKTLLMSAPIWGLVAGLVVGGVGIGIPEFVIKPLKIIREVNTFLPLFVLGFYFKPILDNIKVVFNAIFIKMVLGLCLGISLSFLFTESIDKITIILASSAPVGVVSLVFASVYDKDTKFASSLVSYSIAVGIILLTVLEYSFNVFGLK